MNWFGSVVAWFRDGSHWQGPDGVLQRLVEHVGVSAAALGIACALAIPLALWLGHVHRGGSLAWGGLQKVDGRWSFAQGWDAPRGERELYVYKEVTK